MVTSDTLKAASLVVEALDQLNKQLKELSEWGYYYVNKVDLMFDDGLIGTYHHEDPVGMFEF
jgi:threonyl-tRNA synthetase